MLEELEHPSGVRFALEDVDDHAGCVPKVDNRSVARLGENYAIEPVEDLDRRVLGDLIRRVADREDEPLLVSEGFHAVGRVWDQDRRQPMSRTGGNRVPRTPITVGLSG